MPLTLLAVAAHMDDAEYGVGGIIVQAARAGHRVVVVVTVSDYTTWEPTIGREEQCKRQQLELAERFGYEKRFLDYPYHRFISDNETKTALAKIYDEIKPDIAFVHNAEDYWPDHVQSGLAAREAVLFPHGYTKSHGVRRCPRVFAFNIAEHQTIRFEPDYFVDVSAEMPEYMDLLAGADSCLSGKPTEELILREIKDNETGATYRASNHGWYRLTQCALWGQLRRTGPYAIGLQTLWGKRDGSPLW